MAVIPKKIMLEMDDKNLSKIMVFGLKLQITSKDFHYFLSESSA